MDAIIQLQERFKKEEEERKKIEEERCKRDPQFNLNKRVCWLLDDMEGNIHKCILKTKIQISQDIYGPVGASRGPLPYDPITMEQVIPKRLEQLEKKLEEMLNNFRQHREQFFVQ